MDGCRPASVRTTRPTRSPPQSALHRACERRGRVWVVSTGGVVRLRSAAERTPVLVLDRHCPRRRVGRAATGASPLPPPRPARQRTVLGRDGAAACSAGLTARLRNLAVERRERRARRGRLPEDRVGGPADPGRSRGIRAGTRRGVAADELDDPVLAFVGRARRPAEERRPPPRRRSRLLPGVRAAPRRGRRPAGPLPERVGGDRSRSIGGGAPPTDDDPRPPLPPGGLRDRGRPRRWPPGVPVVTTPCGGPERRSSATRGEAGLVVSGFSPEELGNVGADAARRSGPAGADAGRDGREHVAREHSPARFRQLLADAFAEERTT